MDSSADPQAFDDKKSEAVPEGAANAASAASGDANSMSHALTPFEPRPAAPGETESQESPKVESFPGSALVILPPKKEKIGGGFSAGERLGGPAQAKRSSLTSNALRAAAVLVIAGGAYAIGSHYLSAPSASAPPAHLAAMAPQSAAPAAVAPPAAEAASSVAPVGADGPQLDALRHQTIVLNNEVHKLQARLAALQGEPDQVRSLRKSLDGLKAGFEAEKADYKAQIAQLTAKLDHAHTTVAEKTRVARLDAQAIQATLDHAARTETASGDSTGSIPNTGGPVTLASAETPHHTSQPINDWVVRDVYRGIALVEGPQGAVEVMPGDTLPGAGTVRAIERRGDGWVVVTSRGYVDYDHD
jgi:hypothetical protein